MKNKWLERQSKDIFVTARDTDKMLSRASYKLAQIDKKYRLFSKTDRIIELGSAPGGWTQVLSKVISDNGKIVACDLKEMQDFPNVSFVKGDFLENSTQEEIKSLAGYTDWVISDMAANTTGFADIDHLRTMELASSVFSFAKILPKLNKGMLVKLFAGATTNLFVKKLQDFYKKVRIIKPEASRAESKEIYILGLIK